MNRRSVLLRQAGHTAQRHIAAILQRQARCLGGNGQAVKVHIPQGISRAFKACQLHRGYILPLPLAVQRTAGERQARKEAGDTTPQGDAVANIQRGPAPKTRPLAERKGKAYKKVAKLVDKTKHYSLAEALELATQTAVTKFDSTVEIHVRLGVDPKQADQNIRTTVTLPNGTGKSIRVAALVDEGDIAAAKEALLQKRSIQEYKMVQANLARALNRLNTKNYGK